MSRYVRVSDTDYKLTVESGGTITLNTGTNVGLVRVTGNLQVDGDTTYVNVSDMQIEDNIILLNRGETGIGVTEGTAGIQIDRGAAADSQILFDESLSFTSIEGTFNGAFILRDTANRSMALHTKAIITSGDDLRLIGAGTGVVSVSGTVNYENQVTDDDDIPNRKWTTDYVGSYFSSTPPYKIAEADSVLEINDSSDTGETQLTLQLDGNLKAIWTAALHQVQDIRIVGTRIESLTSNTDLELSSPGTGSVKIDDNLKLVLTASDPSYALDGVKLYGKTESAGGSGIYFVNTKNTRDEVASRRKAFAFSMIF